MFKIKKRIERKVKNKKQNRYIGLPLIIKRKVKKYHVRNEKFQDKIA